ncbi:UNVERIFIED_CONTAM: hypothetical protein K2H54_008340 [Gekko kuhli]
MNDNLIKESGALCWSLLQPPGSWLVATTAGISPASLSRAPRLELPLPGGEGCDVLGSMGSWGARQEVRGPSPKMPHRTTGLGECVNPIPEVKFYRLLERVLLCWCSSG